MALVLFKYDLTPEGAVGGGSKILVKNGRNTIQKVIKSVRIGGSGVQKKV